MKRYGRLSNIELFCFENDWTVTIGSRIFLTVSHGGDGEQSPPEAVHEAPLVGGVVLLGEVHQRGEGQHRHEDQHQQKAELTGSLWKIYAKVLDL